MLRLAPLIWLWLAALLLEGCEQPTRLPPLAPDAIILAFGDSLTHGTGAGPGQSYPAVLAQLSGRQVINAGKPGELSGAGLARLAGVLDQHQPGLLLLCHGGNDLLRKQSPERLRDNLRAMVSLARDREIPVLLVGVPRPTLILSTATVYDEVAEELTLAYEGRVLTEILGDNRLKSDPIHPNARGYQLLAETLTQELQRLGAL